jgi:TolA-binding protein
MDKRRAKIAAVLSGVAIALAAFGLAKPSHATPLEQSAGPQQPASPAESTMPTLDSTLAWLQSQITTLQSKLGETQAQLASLQQQLQTQTASLQKLQTAFTNHYHVIATTTTTPGTRTPVLFAEFNCPGLGQPCTANFSLPPASHGQVGWVMYPEPQGFTQGSTSTSTQNTSGPVTP